MMLDGGGMGMGGGQEDIAPRAQMPCPLCGQMMPQGQIASTGSARNPLVREELLARMMGAAGADQRPME